MPKLSDTQVPSYRGHKQSGQPIVTLSGRDVLLGKYGTRESREKYNGTIAEWLAAGRQLPAPPQEITIAEIVNSFRKHAQGCYRRPDGTPTTEAARVVLELSPLVKFFARAPACEFGPLKLKAVRESMIGLGWCRMSFKHATSTIKRRRSITLRRSYLTALSSCGDDQPATDNRHEIG